jgi:hypothetical protein
MAATLDTRRTFALRYDAALTLPDRIVSIDRVAVVGCAMMMRDSETGVWFSAEEVMEPLDSPVMRRICGVVNGLVEYGREVRNA